MGWFNKIFKGSRLQHNHNGYYENYPNACSSHDEPSADTDAERDEPHTQESSTSEVSVIVDEDGYCFSHRC